MGTWEEDNRMGPPNPSPEEQNENNEEANENSENEELDENLNEEGNGEGDNTNNESNQNSNDSSSDQVSEEEKEGKRKFDAEKISKELKEKFDKIKKEALDNKPTNNYNKQRKAEKQLAKSEKANKEFEKKQAKFEKANKKLEKNPNSNFRQQRAKNASNNAKKAADQATKQAKKAQKAVDVAAKTTAKSGSLAAVIFWAIVIIVVIIIVVGVIYFFMAMPGVAWEKLNGFKRAIWKMAVGLEADVTDERMVKTAEYLESMGWDLAKYGFIGEYEVKTNGNENVTKKTFVGPKLNSSITLYDENNNTLSPGEIYNQSVIYNKYTARNAQGTHNYSPADFYEGFIAYNEDGTVAEVKSKYLFKYILSDIRTFSTSDFNWRDYWKNFFTETAEERYNGDGMIEVYSKPVTDIIENSSIKDDLIANFKYNYYDVNDFSANFAVDANMETKRLEFYHEENDAMGVIQQLLANLPFVSLPYEYYYDMQGWTGKYGMPLEFLLALHLGTLAPDFAYDIATHIEPKVKINVVFTEAKIAVGWQEGYEPTDEQKEYVLENYGETGEVEIKVPIAYITEVTDHWFEELDFTGCYDFVAGTVEEYNYKGTDKNLEGARITETRPYTLKQTKEPEIKDNSSHIRTLLKKEDWKIFDGTEDVKTGKIQMNKTFHEAIAILENVQGEDAEHITRKLKTLLKDFEFTFDTDKQHIDGDMMTYDFSWPIPEYKPLNWPTKEEAIGNQAIIKYTGDEKGLREGLLVESPSNATVHNVTSESVTLLMEYDRRIEGVETTRKVLITISGIEVVVNKGDTLNAGDVVGKTKAKNVGLAATDVHKNELNVQLFLKPFKVTYSGSGSYSDATNLTEFLISLESQPMNADETKYVVYDDGYGFPTAGIGIKLAEYMGGPDLYGLGLPTTEGAEIDKEILDEIYNIRLSEQYNIINSFADNNGIHFEQHQVDALISLGHSGEKWMRLALKSYAEGGADAMWDDPWCMIVHVGNETVLGLVTRREAEFELFLTGNYAAQSYGRKLIYYSDAQRVRERIPLDWGR